MRCFRCASDRWPLRGARRHGRPGAARPAANGQANYVVGPEDMLSVTVFNEAQLSGRYRVENDGHFSYPFLGRVKAGGATLAEVAASHQGPARPTAISATRR